MATRGLGLRAGRYGRGPVETRRLGRTGHESAVAIFGAAALARATPDEARAALDDALAAGANHIDVAPRYGAAERLLGPILPAVRDKLFVGCKTTRRNPDGVRAQLEESLTVLGCVRDDGQPGLLPELGRGAEQESPEQQLEERVRERRHQRCNRRQQWSGEQDRTSADPVHEVASGEGRRERTDGEEHEDEGRFAQRHVEGLGEAGYDRGYHALPEGEHGGRQIQRKDELAGDR